MSVQPPFDRMHEVDDFGELDPAWAGTRVEWMEVAGTRTRVLRRDGRRRPDRRCSCTGSGARHPTGWRSWGH